MFTGIIEATGIVQEVVSEGSNKTFRIASPISSELRPDQSVTHNGACLTVENIRGDTHQVTAIRETLEKTTLGSWKPGDLINLERSMLMNGRLDGHIVQGHIDTTGECIQMLESNGSREIRIRFAKEFGHLIIEKGSICFDGISLTIYNLFLNEFSVAIIPYTFDHTNFRSLAIGAKVNLEFDLIGKYLSRFTAVSKGLL